MEEFSIKQDLSEIVSQIEEGIVTEDEAREYLEMLSEEGIISLMDAENFLISNGLKELDKKENEIIIKYIDDKEIETINSFYSLFFHELLGRAPNEEDHKIHDSIKIVAEKDFADIGIHPIGYVEYAFEPSKAYEHACYIDKLIVDKRFRAKGVGSILLYNVVCDAYDENNIESVILHSYENSNDFYEKNGFIKTHEIFKEDDKDLLKMVLPFTKRCYVDICMHEIDPNESKILKIKKKLDKTILEEIEDEKIVFEENPYLESLRFNLPKDVKYNVKH